MRRGQLELYLDILKTIDEGNHKLTHISYQSNIHRNRARQILNHLIKKDVVTLDPNLEAYFFTESTIPFNRLIQALRKFLLN